MLYVYRSYKYKTKNKQTFFQFFYFPKMIFADPKFWVYYRQFFLNITYGLEILFLTHKNSD